MAPSEAQRSRLRVRLGDWLEEEDVTTLMESLPPVSWEELATKKDLAALEERIDAKFIALRGEMKLGFARQLYFTLVGMAAMITPIYIALFTGVA